MGLNAVVAYSLCLGEVGVDWRVAMAVVLVEGVVILILVLCGLRKAIMDAILVDLRRAIGIGIGLFIAFIGLGLEAVSWYPTTPRCWRWATSPRPHASSRSSRSS